MKTRLTTILCTLALAGAFVGATARAQEGANTAKLNPAPVIIKYQAHAMHAVDFQARMNKDPSLRAAVQSKGIDVAFTEWMQRDHPTIFRKECIKQAGAIAKEFKSTAHMQDFDVLIRKRGDLRALADKYGHDYAFAEWLRTEHPDTYRQHFGLDASNKLLPKQEKPDKKTDQ